MSDAGFKRHAMTSRRCKGSKEIRLPRFDRPNRGIVAMHQQLILLPRVDFVIPPRPKIEGGLRCAGFQAPATERTIIDVCIDIDPVKW
jgi:hypothetical protein